MFGRTTLDGFRDDLARLLGGAFAGLGLETLGVKIERGTIVVDGFGRTNVAGIYAIGDVALEDGVRKKRTMRSLMTKSSMIS